MPMCRAHRNRRRGHARLRGTMSDRSSGPGAERALSRIPQNVVAGLGLVLLGAFGVWATGDLPRGTLGAMGPGMLPHWVAIGVAATTGASPATGDATRAPRTRARERSDAATTNGRGAANDRPRTEAS